MKIKFKIDERVENEKCSDHDRISIKFSKCCSPIIAKKLVKAFYICLEEHKVLQGIKIVKIIPLLAKKIPASYRPISLLKSVSWLFEKLFWKHMIRFFQKNKLLRPMRFGFISKRSCTHSISTLTEFMRTQIDNKLSGQACSIVLKIAFDSIDHNVSLQKLYAYGFQESIYDSIDDYLKDRMQ